ncbi:hypothetical protein NE237_001507 [Protea cynaroides]|uniref:Secreted protein n=1 Tax=Protea cynaroides TaxID=273540 RepID=A0A9Q0KUA5_9MAGN|nr:hypothetical protein NE237_001507 [Protea cynaroides]
MTYHSLTRFYLILTYFLVQIFGDRVVGSCSDLNTLVPPSTPILVVNCQKIEVILVITFTQIVLVKVKKGFGSASKAFVALYLVRGSKEGSGSASKAWCSHRSAVQVCSRSYHA